MSDNITDDEFKKIDIALELYYTQNNIFNYRSNDGRGRFMKYIIDEQLNDPEVPIENELGSDCDPTDCAYSWMNNNSDDPFPVPNDIQIPQKHMKEYIFYILQHCWKYNQPPTNTYIKQHILRKVHGTSTNSVGSRKMANFEQPFEAMKQYIVTKKHGTFTNNIAWKPLTNKSQNKSDDNMVDEKDEKRETQIRLKSELNGDAKEFVPKCALLPLTEGNITRISKKPFIPKYSARAHLNIHIAKAMTTDLLGIIAEHFENELHLYYYIDISTALQMNDNQVYVYTVSMDGEQQQFGIINYDFHCKQKGCILYGIFVPNDHNKIQQDKWLWKLDEFLTATQILDEYDVKPSEFPLSSRKMPQFERQLKCESMDDEKLIDDTDWFKVEKIKSSKRNVKIPKVTITLSKEMWIKECKKSFQNIDLPLIPAVVNKNNQHWIEWIKIIHIKSQNIYIGISCKYNQENDEWKVQSMCLDRGDIYNKHRLVGLNDNKYIEQLPNFQTSTTEIIYNDNPATNKDTKLHRLKNQITLQQNKIKSLKEDILRMQNKHSNNHNNITPEPLMEHDLMQNDKDNMDDMDDTKDSLNEIVDDNKSEYDVLPFKTNPIGAKMNIYINKQFTKSWINYVFPRFADEAMMYYWLDYTTAIQMIQKYAKKYVDKINDVFMCAVINYELKDNQNNNLYGIIFADGTKDKNNDKYPYKLAELMTAEQIHRKFGIKRYDLPKKSRKHSKFINKLILKRKILKQDLSQIRWANLKSFKSQSNNTDHVNKSVIMTRNVMREYINKSIERINNNNNDNDRKRGNNLIPIMVINKHKNYYDIEWVLIVDIMHCDCSVGVSFGYNTNKNLFVATSIYLDKGEIELKHKLIGLKYDYCQNIPSFSLKKLEWKADKNGFVDDVVHNNNDKSIITDHKKLLPNEQIKYQQLQQQMMNQHQVYLQEIDNKQYGVHQMQQQQQMMYQQQQPYQLNNYNMNINGYYNWYNGYNGYGGLQ